MRELVVRLRWPLPALLSWALAWLVYLAARQAAAPAAAFVVGGLVGAACALAGTTPWRRLLVGCGFPVSFALARGTADGLPAWAWLAPLGVLALVYPARAWRDAPLFPTRAGTLRGLGRALALEPGARILDAGAGLGDALRELAREFPAASLEGVEWSRPLAAIARLRCRGVDVRSADLWRVDWSPYRLVYVFQRPESMARVLEKAARELAPGAWLASLEFAIDGVRPTRTFRCADGRPLWLYRAPIERRRATERRRGARRPSVRSSSED